MLRRGARGFTLLEMLVVVAIMMVLMALIFPVAMSAYENAHRTACMSNLQLIAQRVEAYRQDYLVYPNMPNYVGLHGIPQGGVTGLALASADLSPKSFWCNRDPFPGQYPASLSATATARAKSGLERDLTFSTYQSSYNYYGYVADIDGLPFPVTTLEAFRFFFGDALQVYRQYFSDADLTAMGVVDPDWDLGMVVRKPKKGDIPEFVPRGLTQALWNTWAPKDTLITYCTYHPAGKPKVVPAVNLAGEALLLRPIRPTAPPQKPATIDDQTGKTFALVNKSSAVLRKPVIYMPDPGDPAKKLPVYYTRWKAPVDWRVNRGTYRVRKDGTNNQVIEDSKYISDSLKAPQNMPVVETYYRKVNAKVGSGGMTFDSSNFYPWYDTGIGLLPGDMVMIVADAKWNFYDIPREKWLDPNNGWASASGEYEPLFDDTNRLWFTAMGNPVELSHTAIKADMLLPDHPHCTLVGFVGDPIADFTGGNVDDDGDAANPSPRLENYFAIGSRSSFIVTGNFADPRTLRVAMNDIRGAAANSDNYGRCELRIAVYRRNSALLPAP